MKNMYIFKCSYLEKADHVCFKCLVILLAVLFTTEHS